MLNSSINQKYIGINIGSVSVNVVISDDFGSLTSEKKSHLGNPQKILKGILDPYKNEEKDFYGVSGTFGDITEINAIERALSSIEEKYDVISLGSNDVDVTEWGEVKYFFLSNDVDIVLNMFGKN